MTRDFLDRFITSYESVFVLNVYFLSLAITCKIKDFLSHGKKFSIFASYFAAAGTSGLEKTNKNIDI